MKSVRKNHVETLCSQNRATGMTCSQKRATEVKETKTHCSQLRRKVKDGGQPVAQLMTGPHSSGISDSVRITTGTVKGKVVMQHICTLGTQAGTCLHLSMLL